MTRHQTSDTPIDTVASETGYTEPAAIHRYYWAV